MNQKIREIFGQDQKPVRRLVAAFLRHSHLGKLITFRVQDYLIRFYPSGISSLYWYNPHAREDDYQFIKAILKPGETCIDIGANIGITVIPAGQAVGETGQVIAFEPHPMTFHYLKNNIALNHLSNVQLHNCALGNEKGTVYFTSKHTDETNHVSAETEGIKVPITLLDEVCGNLEHVALLKLDVEGYEKFVLQGGETTLSKTDCVYCELCEDNFQMVGYSGKEVLTELQKLGFYLFRRLSPRTQLIAIDCDDLPQAKYENIIAIKNVADFITKTGWEVDQNYQEQGILELVS